MMGLPQKCSAGLARRLHVEGGWCDTGGERGLKAT